MGNATRSGIAMRPAPHPARQQAAPRFLFATKWALQYEFDCENGRKRTGVSAGVVHANSCTNRGNTQHVPGAHRSRLPRTGPPVRPGVPDLLRTMPANVALRTWMVNSIDYQSAWLGQTDAALSARECGTPGHCGALVREILMLAQQIRARMLLVRAASAIGLAETWVRPDRIWS